ncbi:MAG: hypothetical protein KBD21_01770 [Candidatus Pacebacteria bacterium]|nr:hypothetical protein [Candidatus Paceibacterota bacterium]
MVGVGTRRRRFLSSAGVALLVFVLTPSVVAHAQNTEWIDTLASEALEAIGAVIPALAGLALALFIWGGVVMLASQGSDESRKEGQTRMLWGLIALFVLVSVWGLVQLVQVFFGVGGTQVTPPLPGATYDG